MATWTTPATYTAGQTMTAALMNTHIRDNMQYIYDNSGTIIGKRVVEVPIFSSNDTVTTGDGKAYLVIPYEFNGMNIIKSELAEITAATAGVTTVQIARIGTAGTADILDIRMTIDINERTSYTAANASVIGTANRLMATGDMVRWDVDVAGTTALGLIGILTLQMP
jgi:hypothetical protein